MKKTTYLLPLILLVMCLSCNKQDAFLDVKSNKSDVRPGKLADYQAMLDNDAVMNAWAPATGLVSSDNFYIDFPVWQATSTAQERNAYVWASDIYNGEPGFDWQLSYQVVAYANIVLEGLDQIPMTADNANEWKLARGSALFFRAFAFYEIAQIFAPPYDPSTASTTLGIPLKLDADAGKAYPRASLADTYDQIMTDLDAAIALLPASTMARTRPTRVAALALKARVLLTQGNYKGAFEQADAVIQSGAQLTDFNTVSNATTPAFPAYPNTIGEVLFYAGSVGFGLLSYNNLKVDTTLYRSYAANDLRRSMFFRDNGTAGVSYRGDFMGTIVSSKFSGFALNEQYLIRAEASARFGNTAAAMSDLNTLLVKRWKTGTYLAMAASSPADALAKVLTERRKELPLCCNLRWEDLRRLNREPAFAKTLTRVLNGITFTLPPNDPKYVLPIPDIEIQLNRIPQNPR